MPKSSSFLPTTNAQLVYHPLRSKMRQTRLAAAATDVNIVHFDPQDVVRIKYFQELRAKLQSGHLASFNVNTLQWDNWSPPLRILKSGVIKTAAPPSYANMPGYTPPICPDATNPFRTEEDCQMHVVTSRYQGKTRYTFMAKHEGCIYRMPIMYNGVEVVDMMADDLDEDSEDEIDVFSTAHFNTTSSTPSSSGSSGCTLADMSSSPPQYQLSPVKSTLPGAADVDVFSATPVKKGPEVLFTVVEMAERRNYDFELVKHLREQEEQDLFHDHPDRHPAWPGAQELHPRMVPYDRMHPSVLFKHLDMHDTPVGKIVQDLNGIAGVAPAAFRTLKGTSTLYPSCACEYSATAFMTHIHDGRCLNSKSDNRVENIIALDSHGGHMIHIDKHLTDLRQKLPEYVRKKDALIPSTLGILYAMWNSRLGLPVDIWMVAQTAVITCKDCWLVRTFDADSAHRTEDGACLIIAAAGRDGAGSSGMKGKGKAVDVGGGGGGDTECVGGSQAGMTPGNGNPVQVT